MMIEDATPQDRAIVTAINTSPTCAEAPAKVCGVERRLKAFVDRVVERPIQFAALAWHQRTPDPEVHEVIKLKLPDRIDQADIGISREMLRPPPTAQLKHSVLNVNPTCLWIFPLI